MITSRRFSVRQWLVIAGEVSALIVFAPGGAASQEIQSRPLHRGATAGGADRRTAPLQTSEFNGAARYHSGATLLCSDCHASHFSESHDFSGGSVSPTGALNGDWLGPIGPNPYLLKAPTSTELCLSCHDGQTFAPDVVTSDVNGLTQRSAGFFGELGVPTYKGHNLSSNPGGKPGSSELCNRCHFVGSMATASVQCIDCHNYHGNSSYRNLWWASAPGSEPPLLAAIAPGATGLARYERGNVGYPAPSAGGWAEVTNMCVDCHHTFFAPWYTQSTSPYHRHPGVNSESGGFYPINRTGAHTDADNWLAGGAGFGVPRLPFVVVGATDFASATTVAANNQVFCLTCHKAHGSENPFGLRWDYGSRTATGLDGCQQCHNNVWTE